MRKEMQNKIFLDANRTFSWATHNTKQPFAYEQTGFLSYFGSFLLSISALFLVFERH